MTEIMSATLNATPVRTVSEPDARFGDLMDSVGLGTVTVIFRDGKPFATISPYVPVKSTRKPGGLGGNFWMAGDFDETPADVVDSFENSSI